MKISIIAAASTNRAIGVAKGLPWHLPADLRFFKEKTIGHHLLMGRRTWETFKKPLPGRTSMVISKSSLNLPEGVFQFSDIESAIDFAKGRGETDLMVIGGGQIFEAALPLADEIFLTHVFTKVHDVTAWFPSVKQSEWEIQESLAFPKDDTNPHYMEFLRLKKTSPSQLETG